MLKTITHGNQSEQKQPPTESNFFFQQLPMEFQRYHTRPPMYCYMACRLSPPLCFFWNSPKYILRKTLHFYTIETSDVLYFFRTRTTGTYHVVPSKVKWGAQGVPQPNEPCNLCKHLRGRGNRLTKHGTKGLCQTSMI